MSSKPLICLITPGHVSSTPRLVKNADALVEAGYRVHVLAAAPFPPSDRLDAEILGGARWEYSSIACRSGVPAICRKILHRAARWLAQHLRFESFGIITRAHYAMSGQLASAATRIPAQLFIGHCLAALPVASIAANSNGRPFGFDIEDFHDAETEEAMADPLERRIRFLLQSHLLPKCRLLLCAAPLIAQKYNEIYKVAPLTLLNVFPLSYAPKEPIPQAPITEERPAVFYWFSQTVGPGRGLEKIIAVMGKMRTPIQLHLRGFVTNDYSRSLQHLASEAGLKRPLIFLEPGAPQEMARLAAASDIGLSTEERLPLNRDICLPNKIFIYLMAGIPQLLSATSAQSLLAGELGEAAIQCHLGNVDETATALDAFLSDPDRIEAARKSAGNLARGRFCWDLEKAILINAVDHLLPPT